MTGITDLDTIVKNMNPVLDTKDTYEFITVPEKLLDNKKEKGENLNKILYEDFYPYAIATFHEEEGLTFVMPTSVLSCLRCKNYVEELSQLLIPSQEMQRITMMVNSSLNAVGFTAVFSKILADTGISCNVFAGYYHDHLFIPFGLAERGIEVLQNAQRQSL